MATRDADEQENTYNITTEFTSGLLDDLKGNVEPPLTRSKHGSKRVLEYNNGTTIELHGSNYIHKLLHRPSKAIHPQEVGNFVLNLALPLPAIGSIDETGRCRFGKVKLIKAFGESAPAVEEILAGSLSEGLSLPEVKHIKSKNSITELPDEDWKYICHGLTVSNGNKSAFATLEPTLASPSTFVKLRFNEAFSAKLAKCVRLDPDIFIRKDGLIDRDKFISHIRDILKVHVRSFSPNGQTVKCKDGQEPEIVFSKHGPATTVDVNDEFSTTFSSDLVICLPCPIWPQQAKAWPKRKRSWPSKGLVKKIVREGCHLVAKGHKGSKDEKDQFIFSFSLCDKTLSKAMSLNQKRCYMLFKFVFKNFLNKIPRGLTSFCCKVTFLWTCEFTPETQWSDGTLMDCLVGLVAKLKEFLGARHLPHFYIPEYNLIEEMTETAMDACIRDINRFLEEPLGIVLQLIDSHRFRWLSNDISLADVLENVLSKRACGTDIAIGSSVLTFFSDLLDKGEGLLVLSIICKDWRWTSNVESDTQVCIQSLEDMIALLDGSGSLVCLQGLLGNLYHQMAYKTKDLKYIEKSLEVFLKARAAAGRHTWVTACYYDLMFYCQTHDTVLRHFLAYLRKEMIYTPSVYTVLTNYNCYTGSNFAEIFGYAHIPTTAYILFQVISCYMALAQMSYSPYKRWLLRNEAQKVLKHLRKWTIRKCKLYPELFDDQLNYMVGLAAKTVGDKDIAIESYQETLSYGLSVLGIDLDDLGQVPVVPDYMLARTKITFDRGSLRYQPYRKAKKGQHVGLSKDLLFVDGVPQVGKYVHN